MANQLKMAIIQAILSLHGQGWTQVRIAETLQVDRKTVRKYVRQQSGGPKPPNAPTDSPGEPPECPAANAPFASGPASQCAPYRELIAAKLVENL